MKKLLCLLSFTLTAALSAHAAGPYHKDLLKGTENDLVKADQSKADIAALHGKKYTFIYFSAHWCPPCRAFTPKLVSFYNDNKKNNDFELLFVSSDKSQEAMFKYMEETKMPWIGLKKDSPAAGPLKQKFGVKGIPCLVLLNEKDEIIASSYGTDGKYKGPQVALEKYLELHKK